MATKKQTPKNVFIEILAKQACPNDGKKKTILPVRGAYEYINAKKNLVGHYCGNCINLMFAQAKVYEKDSGRSVIFNPLMGGTAGSITPEMEAWNKTREEGQGQ